MSRGKGAFARLLSSLPHYSIMMACGVCRTPFALIASAFSPPRCSLARFEHRLLSCSLSLSPSSLLSPLSSTIFSFSLDRVRSSFAFPCSSLDYHRCFPPDTSLSHQRTFYARVSFFSSRERLRWPVDFSRARVHIAVTMMCVILRRLANVNP